MVSWEQRKLHLNHRRNSNSFWAWVNKWRIQCFYWIVCSLKELFSSLVKVLGVGNRLLMDECCCCCWLFFDRSTHVQMRVIVQGNWSLVRWLIDVFSCIRKPHQVCKFSVSWDKRYRLLLNEKYRHDSEQGHDLHENWHLRWNWSHHRNVSWCFLVRCLQ